jgi:hypothetical protein
MQDTLAPTRFTDTDGSTMQAFAEVSAGNGDTTTASKAMAPAPTRAVWISAHVFLARDRCMTRAR